MKKYNTRTWLNSIKSSSTDSVVCYYGIHPWNRKLIDMFLEIGSCHDIIRLHKTKHFIAKLKMLRKAIDKFITFLEKLD